MTIKKTPFLKELQDYIREGSRKVSILENGLVRAEDHIKKLERKDTQQELINANATIKKLSDELKELKKDPHAALNPTEKKLEGILHRIVEAENYQLGTYIRVLEGLNEGKDIGSIEQKNALIKYRDKLDNARKYLTSQESKYKEAIMPDKTKLKQKPNTPGNEILGENYFD